MTSSFVYGAADFISDMTTPYGTTHFDFHAPPVVSPPWPTDKDLLDPMQTWLMATDPLGQKERVEFRHGWYSCGGIGQPACIILRHEDSTQVPQGMANIWNDWLDYRNTYYWDKHAWMDYPHDPPDAPDYSKALVLHWLHQGPQDWPAVVSPVLESYKRPLENRVWFEYPGQNPGEAWIGTSTLPIKVGRVLDDGTTQLMQYEYDDAGNVTKRTDPLGRVSTYTYSTDGVDLIDVKQQTASGLDTLEHWTYNPQHQPLTFTDAANRTTIYTYNGDGLLETIENPKNELTTLTYQTAPDPPYFLKRIDRPLSWVMHFGYDSYGRVHTVQNSDNDIFIYDHDPLDRPTVVTYPDTTTSEIIYDKLDVWKTIDRRSKATTYDHDAAGQLTTITDAEDRQTHFTWCGCGGFIGSITDGLDHTTEWQRDVQGRATDKVFEDTTSIVYTYGARTSRLQDIMDARLQHKSFTYFQDDLLHEVTYSGTATPTVTYGYDPYYPRVIAITDGNGATTYAYRPAGTDGALQVESVDGPLADDTIAYGYDELGRVLSRLVNGVGISARSYDALSRVTSETDVLGAVTVGYDGSTERPLTAQFPNTMIAGFTYFDQLQSRRLQQLAFAAPIVGLIDKFQYTYDPDGDVLTWMQAHGATPDVATYDDARWLSTYTRNGPGLFSYNYDDAANRTVEQSPLWTTTFAPNTVNAYTGWVKTFPSQPPQSVTLTNDFNGNLTDDQQRLYDWDAEDRLKKVTQGARTSEFSYDGASRRTRIVEKNGATLLSDRTYIWCGAEPCEERNTATNAITRRFLATGFQAGATKYWYTRDHLGSIRSLVNSAGTAVTKYSYDPWGRPSKLFGTVEPPFGYAGYWTQANGGLNLTWYRAYSPELARWLSRDPIGEAGGVNLYEYVGNSPPNYTDPTGEFAVAAALPFLAPLGPVGAVIGAAAFVGSAIFVGFEISQAIRQSPPPGCQARAKSKARARVDPMPDHARPRKKSGSCLCFNNPDKPEHFGACATDFECDTKCKANDYVWGECVFEG